MPRHYLFFSAFLALVLAFWPFAGVYSAESEPAAPSRLPVNTQPENPDQKPTPENPALESQVREEPSLPNGTKEQDQVPEQQINKDPSPQDQATEEKLRDDKPATETATSPGTSQVQAIETRPQEEELSKDATETYAYLLMIHSILDEDEASLLEIAPLLAKSGSSPSIWQDGGLWLTSRKSNSVIPFMEQAIAAYPDDINLNLILADAFGEHGMASRGVDLMRSYLDRHPGNLEARLELALQLVKDNQFDEAGKILSSISAKERTFLVDYYQAKALLGMGKRKEALPFLRKAVKGMPDFVEAIADLAVALEQDGNLREARTTYEKLLKLQFSPQEIALRLINLSLRLKQPDKALQYIKQGPQALPFRLAAANMLLQSRHYLQAENILKQIAQKPDAPVEVYLLLADIVYEQRRNLPQALSWLNNIPPNKPGIEKAGLLRVQLYAEANKIAQALAEADKALKEFPDSFELMDMKIRLLAREKKTEEALALARQAAGKWPDNTQLAFLLGSLLDEKGEKAEAFKVMEQIISREPDNFQALNYVGFSLAEENREIDKALEMLRKADKLSPDQAYIVDSLAWALHRAGKDDEALNEIRRAIKLDESTNDAAIWDHYGDIALKKGHKEEARKAFRRAIELKPANVSDIRKKLSQI